MSCFYCGGERRRCVKSLRTSEWWLSSLGACTTTELLRRLNTWTQKQGTIRLSEDDGPPAIEFLSNEFDEDHQHIGDDEPLAVTAKRLRAANADAASAGIGSEGFEEDEVSSGSPPPPLPKP